MQHRALGAIFCSLIGLLAFAGCSSGSGGGGGGGGGGSSSFDCNSGCDKILAVQCPNDTKDECVSGCNDDLAKAGSCKSQLQGIYACSLTLPLSCSSAGKATFDQTQLYNTCYSQTIAYGKCAICEADSGDTACDTCSKQNCCTQMRSIYDDPNFKAYFECYQACQDSTCVSNCVSQYPTIMNIAKTVSDCKSSKCASPCSGA